jgi:Na+/H+ antiporter NhaD/arsenite permease-like protein
MTAIVIFVLTYGLITARRLRWLPLGRPAAAMLGAVLMVVAGVLTPEASYAAVDHDTLVLLLGMMILSAYLIRAGVFRWVCDRAVRAAKTPLRLLLGLGWLAGVLSAFLVNDTVCLFLTPAVVEVCRRSKLPMGPYLLALATSANLGSAATLVGNPQNMLIGSMSGLGFAPFLASSGLAALAGLAVNSALLWLYFRKDIGDHPLERPPAQEDALPHEGPPRWLVLAVCAGVVASFFAGAHLGYGALAGAAALMVLSRRDPREVLESVDWALLLFFSGLFVVVAGLESTGLVARGWATAAGHFKLDDPLGLTWFSGAVVAGSNLVSNVPMVLLVGPHLKALGSEALGWVLLAFVSTVAGNLTLVGSVANLIVAEGARKEHELGFWEYFKFGAVSTVAALLVGVPLIVWTA